MAQVAVVGINDDLKGQLPLALYVTKNGLDHDHDETIIGKELVEMVRKDVGAVAAFKLAIKVPDLPRTRSGKTPRKSIADLASGRQAKVTTNNTHCSKSRIFDQKFNFNKTPIFSRVFHQHFFFDNFSREIKVVNS